MPLSVHYYVLSLGATTSMLFEAFRDYLIDIENQGFPVAAPLGTGGPLDHHQLSELARRIDECLEHHYMHDPLRLVVLGDREMQSAFGSVTKHAAAIIACIDGDYSDTPARDLGQIVWPIVKEAMSGLPVTAMRDLKESAAWRQEASGVEAVARVVNKGVRAKLLVEDDFRLRGSISETNQSTVLSPDVDVRDATDDAVDAIIDKVLACGGQVVFMPGGSLSDRKRIVLLLPEGEIT